MELHGRSLRHNLDEAFLRRIQVEIHLPRRAQKLRS